MDLIRALQRELDAIVTRRGFALSSVHLPGYSVDSQHGQLEYHARSEANRRVLLDIYHMPAQRTVTAELWSPSDLDCGLSELTIAAAAIRRRVWVYDPTTELSELTREIVREVASWLTPAEPMDHIDEGAPPT